MIDLDAIRAARLGGKKSGPKVKYHGKTYELAPEMPFEVLESFSAMTSEDTAAVGIASIARVLLGKHYAAFADMSIDDLNALIGGVMEEYGVNNPLPSSAS